MSGPSLSTHDRAGDHPTRSPAASTSIRGSGDDDGADTSGAETSDRSGRSGGSSGDRVSDDAPSIRLHEARWPVTGGLVAAGGVIIVALLVGQVSGFQARSLVEGMKPTLTFAASTYVGAGATVLALMGTMVSFSLSHETEFRASYYMRLRMAAWSTTALIVSGLALFTILAVPITSTDTPEQGYVALYWAALSLGAIGAGLTVMIVLMLNYTVRGLIEIGMHGSSYVVAHHGDE